MDLAPSGRERRSLSDSWQGEVLGSAGLRVVLVLAVPLLHLQHIHRDVLARGDESGAARWPGSFGRSPTAVHTRARPGKCPRGPQGPSKHQHQLTVRGRQRSHEREDESEAALAWVLPTWSPPVVLSVLLEGPRVGCRGSLSRQFLLSRTADGLSRSFPPHHPLGVPPVVPPGPISGPAGLYMSSVPGKRLALSLRVVAAL